MNILILGGTTEASALCRLLEHAPGLTATLSLAGITRSPVLPALAVRRGGFGGVEGLADYLRERRVDALVDATHPFARQMHGNAAQAARLAGVPRLAICRPAWRAGPGDRWTEVASMPDAAAALGATPHRVFLTVGQQELAPFQAAPWHDYLIRSVEPPDPAFLPPRCRCIAARGPFTPEGEVRLLRDAGIDVIVTKNSGGSAVEAKLGAARGLGIPVLLVARPAPPEPPVVPDAAAALDWLRHQAALRGV